MRSDPGGKRLSMAGFVDYLKRNAVGFVALFVALSGGAYALAHNSVGSRELKPKAVGAPHLKASAVRPAKIRTDAVRNRHLREGTVDIAKLDLGSVDARYMLKSEVLFAQVPTGGGLSFSRGATNAIRTDTGQYTVFFNRNVSECAKVGGWNVLGGAVPGTSGEVNTGTSIGNNFAVRVRTWSASGGLVDRAFSLIVVC